jgi:SAM-dependent methyltransferase
MTSGDALPHTLRPPSGSASLPAFDRGWALAPNGERAPFLAYAGHDEVNWSDELEDIHEESSRHHFIDIWTRQALLDGIGESLPAEPTIVDLGCSTGYLLEDLRAHHPRAFLIGVDLVAAGLAKAHRLVPDAALLQADVCDLPIADASVDAVVSANLLEHVPDDVGALREIQRILRPGARAAVVVPAAPHLYDYYDAFLGHERRYRRRELAEKASSVGLRVVLDAHLGALLFPPFWVTKKLNRRRGSISDGEMRQRVLKDIDRTQGSALGSLACNLERRLLGACIRPPFGIRGYTVLEKAAG